MTCLLLVTYAKRCIGFDWAKTFNHTLEGAERDLLLKLKESSILVGLVGWKPL